MERAIDSIGSEGRVVFGGFQSDLVDDSTLELDSAIFLKISDLNNSAELKNLVLRGEGITQRLSPKAYSAANLLIEKAIRFSEMRDIERLEIELPQSEHAFISIFLQKGFRILSQRERYHPGQSVCILEKVIGESYYGDPFDRIQLGRWLLHACLPCKVHQWRPFDDSSDPLIYLPFEISPLHPALRKTNPIGYARRLRGGLFVLDEADCDTQYFDKLENLRLPPDNHINYLMADVLSPEAREALQAKRYVCFDFQEVRNIAGGDNSSLRIPIKEQDVAGVLTVLEEKKIKELRGSKGFVYFLLGRIGNALTVTSERDPNGTLINETPPILAIHCPKWGQSGPGIVGFAEIREKRSLPISEAFTAYDRTIPRALTEDDLNSYALDDKERIVDLLCAELRLFEEPLAYDSALWSEHMSMNGYIMKELEHANSTYLSKDVCELLYRLAPSPVCSTSNTVASTSSKSDCKADIVVIVMRPDEQEAVLDRLPNYSPLLCRRGSYLIAEMVSDAGQTYRIAVVRTRGQGPGDAQQTAHNAIEDLSPQWLALVGIAGGAPDGEFTIGDAVVASRVHDFSVSASMEDDNGNHTTEYQMTGGPVSPVISDLINIFPSIFGSASTWNERDHLRVDRPPIDLSLDKFYGSVAWVEKVVDSLSHQRTKPLVTSRSVGTSGILVKDTELLKDFRKHSREVAHVEMELGGVYRAALTIDNFYPILAVRGISDIVGFKRDPLWTSYACQVAAEAFFTIIKGLPREFLRPRVSKPEDRVAV